MPTVYLGDDAQTEFVANGWGPGERNQSNGENQPNDGLTLSIRGVTYAKGLGVHANSEITFPLDGQYASFRAVIGIDDEVQGFGVVPVTAFVRGDGVLLYDSGEVLDTMQGIPIDIDVSGYTTLRLEALALGGSYNAAHFDWADARVSAPVTFAGRDTATSAGSGRFVVARSLAGIGSGEASGSARFSAQRNLLGSSAGQSSSLARYSCSRGLAALSAAESSSSASWSCVRSLAATSAGQSGSRASYSRARMLAGTAAGVATASAALRVSRTLRAIAAAGAGAVSSRLQLIRSLAGVSAGASMVRGALAVLRSLAGVSAGVGSDFLRAMRHAPIERTLTIASVSRKLEPMPETRVLVLQRENRIVDA